MKTILIVSCCCLLVAAWPQELRRPPRAQVPVYQQQPQLLQQQRLQQKNPPELKPNIAGAALSSVPAPDLSQGPVQARPPVQPGFNRQRPSLEQQQRPSLEQQQQEPHAPQALPVSAQRPFKQSAEAQEKPAYPGSVENAGRQYNRPSPPQGARPEAGRPQQPNEQFTRGFPEGFTNGLPQFSFQGRMPEAEAHAEGGFMNDALANFPSLKTLGGFERMGDIDLKSNSPSGFAPSPAEKPQQGKPFKNFRPTAQ